MSHAVPPRGRGKEARRPAAIKGTEPRRGRDAKEMKKETVTEGGRDNPDFSRSANGFRRLSLGGQRGKL